MANSFSNLLSGKSIAVVGPSPHLLGKGLGPQIDSYDLVCRLNEVRQVGLEADYGSKADILFWHLNNCDLESEFKPSYRQDPESFKNAKMLVYPRQHDDVNRRGCGTSTPENNSKKFPPIPFFQVNTETVKQWEEKYQAHLTVGTLSILMILQCSFKKLFVCGFSFYDNDGGPCYHPNHPTSSSKTSVGHDIHKDIQCLREMISGSKNVFGDDIFCKKILM